MGYFFYEPIALHLELIAIAMRMAILLLGGYGGCALVQVWGGETAIACLLGMGLLTLWTWDWTHGLIKDWQIPVTPLQKGGEKRQ